MTQLTIKGVEACDSARPETSGRPTVETETINFGVGRRGRRVRQPIRRTILLRPSHTREEEEEEED